MKTTAQKSIAKGGRAPVPLELEKASQGSRPSSRLPAVARPRVRARSLVARRDRRATNRRGARRPRSTIDRSSVATTRDDGRGWRFFQRVVSSLFQSGSLPGAVRPSLPRRVR
jgi:hypothetical protein